MTSGRLKRFVPTVSILNAENLFVTPNHVCAFLQNWCLVLLGIFPLLHPVIYDESVHLCSAPCISRRIRHFLSFFFYFFPFFVSFFLANCIMMSYF